MKVPRRPARARQMPAPPAGQPRHKSNDDLLQLASAADQAAAARHLGDLQQSADRSAPVQRVRNDLVPVQSLHGPVLMAVLKKYKTAAAADPQAILDDAQAAYTANIARGQKLMADLDALKAEPDNDFGRGIEDIEAERAEKSEASEDLHERAYATRASPQATKGLFATSTCGIGAEKDAYANLVNVPDRGIETSTNFAEKDPNRANGEFLNNSEVFWHQWKAAVVAGTQKGPRKSSRRKKKTRELRQITRKAVMNPDTGLTVHYALPNGTYFDAGTSVTFGPDQEEFAAILGTPNGRGVGYLLKDHFHEMDRQSFGGVEVIGDSYSLRFTFA